MLVAAATGQMMVYSSDRLVWAAKGDICPVAVRVAAFGGQQGLVACPKLHPVAPWVDAYLVHLDTSSTFCSLLPSSPSTSAPLCPLVMSSNLWLSALCKDPSGNSMLFCSDMTLPVFGLRSQPNVLCGPGHAHVPSSQHVRRVTSGSPPQTVNYVHCLLDAHVGHC